MAGVDGAGRRKGSVAEMTNMRIGMSDLSSMAWKRMSIFAVLPSGSSYPDTAQATVLPSRPDIFGSQLSCVVGTCAAAR